MTEQAKANDRPEGSESAAGKLGVTVVSCIRGVSRKLTEPAAQFSQFRLKI